jgi:diamine N-acetyltransferase
MITRDTTERSMRSRLWGEHGMTSPDVHLREITDDNRAAVCELRVRKRQRRFVASVGRSLKDAAASPEDNPWYRAVYRGDEPVGFVMLEWNTPTDRPGVGRYLLWRFLIDKRHQRRGIGREVMRQITDLVRADGATELLTSYQPGKGDPGPFYRRLGFEPPGEIDDGEIVMRLTLAQAS